MRKLARLSTPAVITEKGAAWLDAHLARVEQDPSTRPPSAQYAHATIRDALRTMSHGKCFYCERQLSEREGEVDHYIESSERPDLAFSWANLYLACEGCNNGKPRNRDIPVSECVDPCDAADEPSHHLTYNKEIAEGVPGTKGTRTIQKYRLNRGDLVYQRLKQLQHLTDILLSIAGEMNTRMRQTPNQAQLQVLRRFTEPDMPFSAMLAARLANTFLASGPPGAGPSEG